MVLTKIPVGKGLNWARSERTVWQRIWDSIGRLQHVRLSVPSLKWSLVPRGLARLVAWAGLASAPFWIDYFHKQEVPKGRLVLYSVIMFGLLVLNWALDTFVKNAAREKRLDDHREEAAIEHRNLLNEMLNIVDVPAANLTDAAFMGVVRRSLTAILQRVREELDTLDASYLEVSLMLFKPNEQIAVVERAVRNRAVGANAERKSTMAYFVARAGLDWKHVPDLAWEAPFSFEGISDPSCPYRSVLLMPIIYTYPDMPSEAVGVVTVDSARAYEFWNKGVTERLYKQVMPFVRLLAILLQSHPERVRCG
jgi:hypothetical protein